MQLKKQCVVVWMESTGLRYVSGMVSCKHGDEFPGISWTAELLSASEEVPGLYFGTHTHTHTHQHMTQEWPINLFQVLRCHFYSHV
jgi:hypothetical protein